MHILFYLSLISAFTHGINDIPSQQAPSYKVDYCYDDDGKLIAEIKSTEEQQLRQLYHYDNQGDLQHVVIDTGENSAHKRLEIFPSIKKPSTITLYATDPETGTEVPEKRLEGLYDADSRLICQELFNSFEADPLVQYFDYDSMGHITKLYDINGNGIEATYDNEERLLSQARLVEGVPAQSVVHSYDGDARLFLSEATNSKGVKKFLPYIYDARGNLETRLTPASSSAWDTLTSTASAIDTWVKQNLSDEERIKKDFEQAVIQHFGRAWLIMLGYYQEDPEVGIVGNGELNDKVRVTLINGMLNIRKWAEANARLISTTHANVNVHFVYRPTRGWMHDLIKAGWCQIGFSSYESKLLAETWKELINEMGGPEGGGTIVHYAHSIGGADTYAATAHLTPEEQKMIKVISLGSPLIIPHEGFGSVINYMSLRDGICFLAPLSHLSTFFTDKFNVVYLDSYWGIPVVDHLLNSGSYKTLIETLGRDFVKEYSRAACKINLPEPSQEWSSKG